MPGRLKTLVSRDPVTREQRDHWRAAGFLVLPGFFESRRIDAVNELIEQEWRDRERAENPLVLDSLEGPLGEQRMFFRDAPADAKDRPYKLNDLYLTRPEIRELVLDRRLAAILQVLMGGEPAVCNSLNFERGSQQAYHFDTYFMPGPCVDGLIVTSVCLEDVHEDAGPLTYYPGSQEIPPYRFSHGGVNAAPGEMDDATEYAMAEIGARGLSAVDFLGRKGDVFIWHEQLYHGGRPIRDQARTRRSLVTHYWRADVLEVPEGWRLAEFGRHRSFLERAHQPVPTPEPEPEPDA